jgi:hypothetical protein
MKKNMLVSSFYLLVIVLAVIVIGQYRDSQKLLGANKIKYVQTICDKAHNEVSGQSEQACGDAQDRTNTEYLCNQTGTSCWVEEK